MGSGTSGHVCMGLTFFSMGLWHLFSSIKLHSLHPSSFLSHSWFPVPRARYLEPALIVLVAVAFISVQFFLVSGLMPPAGGMPPDSLRLLEHSLMALSFAVLLDRRSAAAPAKHGLLHFLQAAAFGQLLLIMHLHSTDHRGNEGEYHWLLQIVAFGTLSTAVLAIACPRSFMNSFVGGFSLLFLGLWIIVTGIMLWTPDWMPEGCFIKPETRSSDRVLCRDDRALGEAKALVNLQFGLCFIALTAFSVGLYLVVIKLYPQERVEYRSLTKCEEQEQGDYDVRNHKICIPM